MLLMHIFHFHSSTLTCYVHASWIHLFSSCTLLHYVTCSFMHYVLVYVHRLCHVIRLWLWLCTCPCLYLVHAYVHAYVTPWYALSTLFLESAPLSFNPSTVGPRWVWVYYFSWTSANGIYGGLTGTLGPQWSFRALCLLVVPHVVLCYVMLCSCSHVISYYMLMWENIAHAVVPLRYIMFISLSLLILTCHVYSGIKYA